MSSSPTQHESKTQVLAAPKRKPAVIGDRNANPPDIGFWALVREDFATHNREWMNQGFWTLFWHRFGNWRMDVRPRLLRAPLTLLYKWMFKMCEVFAGIKLSYVVEVGRRVRIEHFGGMILGAKRIGNDVTLRQNTTLGVSSKDDLDAKPVIEDGVEIGAGVCILGSITVGRGSVVGANAVVTKDIPPYSVAVGIPARVIKSIGPQDNQPGGQH